MNEKIPFLNKDVSNVLKGIAAVYIMIGHSIHLPYWKLGFFAFGGDICLLDCSFSIVDMV